MGLGLLGEIIEFFNGVIGKEILDWIRDMS